MAVSWKARKFASAPVDFTLWDIRAAPPPHQTYFATDMSGLRWTQFWAVLIWNPGTSYNTS